MVGFPAERRFFMTKNYSSTICDENMYKAPILVYSNIIWLFPAFVAYVHDNLLLAAPALIIMTLSSLYHATAHDVLELLDTIFAVLYIAVEPILLYAAESNSAWSMAIVACVLTFFVWSQAKKHEQQGNLRAYRTWHTVWHLSTASIAGGIYLVYLNIF